MTEIDLKQQLFPRLSWRKKYQANWRQESFYLPSRYATLVARKYVDAFCKCLR